MKKYEIAKFAKARTVPIQAKVPDFPEMENVEVTVFDVDLKYPTTSTVLHSYMTEQTGLQGCCIKVRTALEENEAELNLEEENAETKGGKPLIGQCDFPASNNQKIVGEKHVLSLLKELSKKRHEPQQYKGVNDSLLAKKAPKEKAAELAKASPAKSPISGKGKTK